MSDPFAHPSILSGTHASLVPLTGAHVAPMRDAVRDGALASLWYTQVPDVAGVDAYLDDAFAMRDAGTALPYAVLDAEGVVVGSTRFYRWDARTPRVTIGYTWIVPRVQRTGLNTEAKLLMLAHAFDTLGCAAVAFETSWFNRTSRTAIERLGARQDGVLRHHMRHPDGSLRDTVVFSILDREWPTVRTHLQTRLACGSSNEH